MSCPVGAEKTDSDSTAFPLIVQGATQARPCIYGLVDPAAPTRVRYVGRAQNPAARLAQHIVAREHCGRWGQGKRVTWIEGLIAAGRFPDMVLLAEMPLNAAREDLDALEGLWIERMRAREMADLNVMVPADRGPRHRPWTRASVNGNRAGGVL